jgi:6,7-dimethyl-8-ribityllumazine synthase
MTGRIGIVVSQFNYEITGEMSSKAQQRAQELGLEVVKVIEVPGSFEIPLAVQDLMENSQIDAVVALGTIIKGGTDHDMVIGHAIANKLLDLSLKFKKPVSLGVSGPNLTWQQSEKRIMEYALRSVDSVAKMLKRNQ